MKIPAEDILVATATYNEATNIHELISRIRAVCGPSQRILIIDDNSPDGTSDIIRGLMASDRHLSLITRKFKLGLGSAHKLMKLYAITHEFKFLVTMDADLSHRPEDIPLLLEHAGADVFVIGSRYAPGGKSDYVGFRKIISLLGNSLAKFVLGIDLNEFTTSFRVFDVNLLRKSRLYEIKTNGYSYFVDIVSMMDKCGAHLIEVPIHFKDRVNDASKIPKSQAVSSLFHLIALAFRRRCTAFEPSVPLAPSGRCRLCGEQSLFPYWLDETQSRFDTLTVHNFACSGVQYESHVPPLHECLVCGLVQIEPSAADRVVHDFYCDTEDEQYLDNFPVKLMTFRNAYKKLADYLPKKKLNVLDIGSYYGAFLEVAQAKGHTVTGIEPSIKAARYSRDVLGHTVISGMFPGSLPFPGSVFDLITAWDVIEHIESPNEFLAGIASVLGDNGIFVCSTIILDSFAAMIFRKRWHWLLPMHLTYFKKHEFIHLLQQHGFEVVANHYHTHYASMSYAVKGAMRNKGPLLNRFGGTLSRILPNGVILPVSLGDVQTFVCKKRDTSPQVP